MPDVAKATTGAIKVNRRWYTPADRYYQWKPDRERVKALGFELYGVEFTRVVRMQIEHDIRTQHRRAKSDGRRSNRRTIHSVEVDGIGRVRVVYHVGRHEIIDVLAPAS